MNSTPVYTQAQQSHAGVDTTKYLADHPPTVVQLSIKPHFEALTDEQKLYAHYISRYV